MGTKTLNFTNDGTVKIKLNGIPIDNFIQAEVYDAVTGAYITGYMSNGFVIRRAIDKEVLDYRSGKINNVFIEDDVYLIKVYGTVEAILLKHNPDRDLLKNVTKCYGYRDSRGVYFEHLADANKSQASIELEDRLSALLSGYRDVNGSDFMDALRNADDKFFNSLNQWLRCSKKDHL